MYFDKISGLEWIISWTSSTILMLICILFQSIFHAISKKTLILRLSPEIVLQLFNPPKSGPRDLRSLISTAKSCSATFQQTTTGVFILRRMKWSDEGSEDNCACVLLMKFLWNRIQNRFLPNLFWMCCVYLAHNSFWHNNIHCWGTDSFTSATFFTDLNKGVYHVYGFLYGVNVKHLNWNVSNFNCNKIN